MVKKITALIKAKHMAVKSKAITIKDRLLIFGLSRNKKMLHLSAMSTKIHALLGKVKRDHNRDQDLNKVIVDYDSNVCMAPFNQANTDQEEVVDEKDPDLTRYLFNERDFKMDANESVIDLVKNARELDATNFNLEDEIDHVADVFIKRFYMRMQIQKQDSFKRYQDMLNRGM